MFRARLATLNKSHFNTICAAAIALLPLTSAIAAPLPQADTRPVKAALIVDASRPVRTINPPMLGGTNVALWNAKADFSSPVTLGWMRDARLRLIRIPGGSWSDVTYWNGNGVLDKSGKADPTKIGPDGYPAIDYSAYAPSILVNDKTLAPSTVAGNVDVKTLQDYVRAVGANPLICVNAGTGRPIDAAEWVRWANLKMHYGAHYWEVGNELDGGWESGHVVPKTGETLTGEMYAAKFHAFATAMKAVDPTIAVGGATTGIQPGSFTEAMMKYAGNDVDFISIHDYSGIGGLSWETALDNVDSTVSQEIGQARKYIAEYQPNRIGKIPIGYSEYNVRTGCSDLFSGMWTSEFLADLARNGASFGTEWDTYTHTRGMSDGQGMILGDAPYKRKAEYFALSLWNNYTGPQLLAPTLTGASSLRSLVTRDENHVALMFINPDKDRPATVAVTLAKFAASNTGTQVTLSNGTYNWNGATAEPNWSDDPTTAKIPTGNKFTVTVPPASVSYVTVTRAASIPPTNSIVAHKERAAPPVLKFMLPASIYAGDSVEGWLVATKPGSGQPYGGPLPDATIAADSTADLDRSHVRLAESIGRFVVRPNTAGPFTLTANLNGAVTTETLTAMTSVPRPKVFWDFTTPDVTDTALFSSDWPLAADYSERANKAVVRIDLPVAGVTTTDHSRTLIRIEKLPSDQDLDKANIRGVFFDVKTKGFVSADPNTSIQVVLQSPDDYWMVLGTIPLIDNPNWTTQQLTITDPQLIKNLPTVFNLWLNLNTAKPATGSIYIDHAGFLVR